jgi:hypothetical protein
MEYRGGCHCGALKLIYRTKVEPVHWPLRACGCSFCRRHGSVATSDPAGSVEFEFGEPARVRRYRFGQGTAEFLVCGECGVFVAAVTNTPSGARAVINVQVITNVPLDLARAAAVVFDDERPEHRAERRSRNWTPVHRAG